MSALFRSLGPAAVMIRNAGRTFSRAALPSKHSRLMTLEAPKAALLVMKRSWGERLSALRNQADCNLSERLGQGHRQLGIGRNRLCPGDDLRDLVPVNLRRIALFGLALPICKGVAGLAVAGDRRMVGVSL